MQNGYEYSLWSILTQEDQKIVSTLSSVTEMIEIIILMYSFQPKSVVINAIAGIIFRDVGPVKTGPHE